MNLPIPIISVVVGLAILLFGRKLFWLFVAAMGFALGIQIAPHLVQQPSPLLALTFALVLGFLGALVALLLQKVAVAVVGFLAGGRLALALASAFLLNHARYDLATFFIGGILGTILLLALFDWALILFSAVEGAHLVQSAISLPAAGRTILFFALVILGILVQTSMLRRAGTAAAD